VHRIKWHKSNRSVLVDTTSAAPCSPVRDACVRVCVCSDEQACCACVVMGERVCVCSDG